MCFFQMHQFYQQHDTEIRLFLSVSMYNLKQDKCNSAWHKQNEI